MELSTLGRADFQRIMTEPKNSLPKQYCALLATEGVKVSFAADGIERLAELAHELNQNTQDIGARRLYTLFEKLLEEPLFQAPDLLPRSGYSIDVTRGLVEERLADIAADTEQSNYIL